MDLDSEESHSPASPHNRAALATSLLLVLCALILPAIATQTLVQFILDYFSKPVTLAGVDGVSVTLLMLLMFLVAVILFLLNGFGVLRNNFSRYAAYLTISFFFLWVVYLAFRGITPVGEGTSVPAMISSVSGIWIVPVVGVLYLTIFEKVSPNKQDAWKICSFVLTTFVILLFFGAMQPLPALL